MAAILNCVDTYVAISSHHVLENGFREQIGLLPTYHQNGDANRVPVFPEVYAVMPRVSKRMGNIRIAKRLEAASVGTPCDAVRRQMPPVRILKLSKGTQNSPVVAFSLINRLERLWRI